MLLYFKIDWLNILDKLTKKHNNFFIQKSHRNLRNEVQQYSDIPSFPERNEENML